MRLTRLVKGAKETFGWVIVGPNRELIIPPEAWRRYGFQVGEEVFFLPGSRKSGGFSITTLRLLAESSINLGDRTLGIGYLTLNREACLPENIPLNPGDRLLTVFGSGHGLGFIAQGPIFEEATRHPGLDTYQKT
jgi:hypothetical protein